jgi:hypothetical protein
MQFYELQNLTGRIKEEETEIGLAFVLIDQTSNTNREGSTDVRSTIKDDN